MDKMIDYKDFSKIDLRLGRVISGESLDGYDRLYKLSVDLGIELGVRTIVAGLKKFYSLEELIGHNVVVVVNLEGKKLGGEFSQGMLLAAGDKEIVSLLVPDRDMPLGAKVF